MTDLISRVAAVCAIEEYEDRLQMVNWKENPGVPYKVHALNWAINTIRELPSVEPERKRGRWITLVDGDGQHYGDKCSECGAWYVMPFEKSNFCPNCGARMDGE